MDEKTSKQLSEGNSWNGIPFYIGDLQKEAELLRGNVIAILHDTAFTVELKDLPTSMVHLNKKRIYVSDRAIPTNLRIYEPIVRRMRDGLAIHEGGHILLGYPLMRETREYLAKHNGSALARVCHNVIEDRRINYRLAARYRWDFGKRLQEVVDVTAESWHYTLQKELQAVHDGKRSAHTLGEVFHQFVCIEGLYGKDCKELRQQFYDLWGASVPRAEVEADILRCCEIIRSAGYVAQGRHVFERVESLHGILQKYVPEDVAADTFAGFMGGIKELNAPDELELKSGDEQQRLDEDRDAGREDESKDSEGGYDAASGTGLEVPAPEPDMVGYHALVARNAALIDALLKRMKRLMQPFTVTAKWQRSGRFMNEVVAHAYAESMTVPVDSVHQRREMRVEPLRSAIGLLVDVSASVNTEEARDLLTIISEVCGRWLRDEDFAIGIFGGAHQRIKTFVEPYHTTRARIGNVHCLSGTMASGPAAVYHAMFRGIGKRRRVFVMVSDFELYDEAEFRREVDAMRREGVEMVGIAFGHTTTSRASRVMGTEDVRHVATPGKLPEEFFNVYRDVTRGRRLSKLIDELKQEA